VSETHRADEPHRPFTRGPLSARSDPSWLNQATVKGTILVLAGLSIVTLTRRSDDLVNEIVGALLVVWALAELWFRVVRRAAPRDLAGLAFPLVLLVGGIVLVGDPGPAISVLVGLALAARGVVLLYGRVTGSATVAAVPRAAVLIVAGLLLVVAPEPFVLGIRALVGAAAMIVGGILVALGLGPKDESEILDLDARGTGRLAEDWLREHRLSTERTEDISDTLFFEPPGRGAKLASFWVMMGLATAIATFAVIQDSTAVVIGAMLVAPLMTPIMGIAAGMVNGWGARMAGSLALVAAAVGAAILLAWVLAAWLPSVGDLASNSQVTSRTSPNLLDLCVAVAAGAAGAYATVDSRVSSSLSGVAIAVALVPPLAVVGITLEAGMGDDAFGAFLLFLTNFVSIVLAGALVLVLTGFARFPRTREDRERQWRFLGPVMIGGLLIVIPLSVTSFSVWTDATDTAEAERIVEDWIGDRELSQVELDVDGDDVVLVITGSAEPPSVAELQQRLEDGLGEDVRLQVRLVPSQELTP
jgi:uncharacterized hydrophobic protein (TIGR00271 family)